MAEAQGHLKQCLSDIQWAALEECQASPSPRGRGVKRLLERVGGFTTVLRDAQVFKIYQCLNC